MPALRYLYQATDRIEQILSDKQTGVRGISFGWHPKAISELKPPPRIVWIRAQSSMGDVQLPGARPQLRTSVNKGVDCVLWGKDSRALEELEERLVNAFEKTFPGTSKLVLGFPFEDQLNRSNPSTQGEAFVLRFTVCCFAQDTYESSDLVSPPFDTELKSTGGTLGDRIAEYGDPG